MIDPTSGYEITYRAVYPWLGPSITSRVSPEAGRVYNAIISGNNDIASLSSAYTRVAPDKLPQYLQELLDMKAIYEDNDDEVDGFGAPFVNGNLPTEYARLGMPQRAFMGNIEHIMKQASGSTASVNPEPLTPLLINNLGNANNNLMNIMSDDTLATIANPAYKPQAQQQISQADLTALMQLATQQKGG